MKRKLTAVRLFALAAIAAMLLTFTPPALGHCQIPCGVYDDTARLKTLAEHIVTIEKSMRLITEPSARPAENANQIVRWVMNKEAHADEFAEIVTRYFLQQRIKPADPADKKASADYIVKLVLCHKMLIASMKAKQTTDLAQAAELKSLLAEFEKAYLGANPGGKATADAHGISRLRGSRTVADSAEETHSIAVGETVPSVTLRTVQGKPFDLRKAVARQPTVLIFYRGGWCPYCNRHLAQLRELEPKLKELGYQILAISPDRPGELAKSIQKQKLEYTLLSDSDMTAAKAFGLAFRVDDATVNLYKTKYSIDLEASSGRRHHELPVPAANVVDRSGKISYEYVNQDYKIRIEPEKLLQEARSALAR